MGAASIVIVIGAVVLAVGVGVSFRINRGKTLIEGARNENSAPWAVTAVAGVVLVAIGVGLAFTSGSKDGRTIGSLLGGAVPTSSAAVANQAVMSSSAPPAASEASSPQDGTAAAGSTTGTTGGCTASATTAEIVNAGNCRSLSYGGIGGAANGDGVYGNATPGQGLKLQFTSIGDSGDWLISFTSGGRTYALVGDSRQEKIVAEQVDLPSTPIVHGNCSPGGGIGGVPCAELWYQALSISGGGVVFLHDSDTHACMALDTHNYDQAILTSCGQDAANPDAGLEDQLWRLPIAPGSDS